MTDDDTGIKAELAEVEAAHDGWHIWQGVVAGLLYARRLRSSPPRVVRAVTVPDLEAAIMTSDRERAAGR